MVGAAFGLGFILGPALGGILGGYCGPRSPFWAAATLSFLNTLYGFFVLPESLPPSRRSPFSWRKANPLGALRLLKSHGDLLGLALVTLISNIAHDVLPSTYVLYTAYRYHWDEKAVGLSLALVGLCSSVVQAMLVGPAVQAWGERRVVLIATTVGCVGFLISGWAPTGRWFWASIPCITFWGMYAPAIQGLMTRRVSDHEHGRLQGAIASIRSIAELSGPSIFTGTFAYFIAANRAHAVPGAAFFLAAGLLACAATAAMVVTRRA
jgi:DHA1 family tetracycline resistance protein-like MFS transporter